MKISCTLVGTLVVIFNFIDSGSPSSSEASNIENERRDIPRLRSRREQTSYFGEASSETETSGILSLRSRAVSLVESRTPVGSSSRNVGTKSGITFQTTFNIPSNEGIKIKKQVPRMGGTGTKWVYKPLQGGRYEGQASIGEGFGIWDDQGYFKKLYRDKKRVAVHRDEHKAERVRELIPFENAYLKTSPKR